MSGGCAVTKPGDSFYVRRVLTGGEVQWASQERRSWDLRAFASRYDLPLARHKASTAFQQDNVVAVSIVDAAEVDRP